ncbi:MAG: MBL fold metallo-hydrolase [Burkholderiaceae bacterium]|nr:MBL fold metallo-hydrolase [Burkholderiaceae bacterium]
MNLLEQALHYPYADQLPASGQLIEVRPGVLWLRMGLPFALNHINLWLIEDSVETSQGRQAGWTAVDCGISDAATQAAWQSLFTPANDASNALRELPILRVIATHCHPDHVGLADWLCTQWQAPLWMTAGEYAFARMMSAGLPGLDGTAMFPHFRKHGLVSAEMLEKIQARKSYYQTLVPSVPTHYRRIQDGQEISIGNYAWRVITGFGHSPEHASLFCADLNCLISGDMLLPRISTNVSVFAVEPEANPVQQYLDSLKKYAALPNDVLVLPSHGKPFTGAAIRVQQLVDHHTERLAEVMAACATAQSAADIVPIMFRRPLDAHQLTFAMGEALAHLHYLWLDGKLQRDLGCDDVYRFRKIEEHAR